MSRHTKLLLTGILGALFALFLQSEDFGIVIAHAQEPVRFPVGTETTISDVVSKVITALNVLTWVVFVFLHFLLDPQFIFDLNDAGQDGAFMNMLNEIWQL